MSPEAENSFFSGWCGWVSVRESVTNTTQKQKKAGNFNLVFFTLVKNMKSSYGDGNLNLCMLKKQGWK